jgi:hypothetical protein
MTTPVIGIYYDSFTSIRGTINKSKEVTVEQTATKLANDVVNKINSTYALDPPLSAENDLSSQYFPDIAGTTDLHSLKGLMILVTPKPEHVGRTSKHWNALNKENKDLKQKNNELENGAGELTLPLFGPSHLMLMSKRTRNGWIESWRFYVAAKGCDGLAGYGSSTAGCAGERES